LYICGDFNGRIGDNDDYIVGVDTLPKREIIDFTSVVDYCFVQHEKLDRFSGFAVTQTYHKG
jgi:hypothetical protein